MLALQIPIKTIRIWVEILNSAICSRVMISISKIIMQILVVRPKLFYPKFYDISIVISIYDAFCTIKTVNLCNYKEILSIKLIPKTDLLFSIDREILTMLEFK
jgi:hypothetical protein